MPDLQFEHITQDRQLAAYCQSQRGVDFLAFDTEFVSENRFRPQLCLIQVATPRGLAIIDALTVTDLRPFWELMGNDVGTTIVHAAREEFLFCYREIGRPPRQLFDVQMVAGFVGYDYPAAYGTLVTQILGHRVSKGETRTDWRQRPLSRKQILYALQDVEHLIPMHQKLLQKLENLGRVDWYWEEIQSWQRQMQATEAEPQWARLAGLSKMNRRELGIVRALYIWREQVAQARERSPRRVLPDDLLLELAKRGESQPHRLTGIRGLSQRVNGKLIPEIGEVVEAALNLPESQLPAKVESGISASIGILGQFLTTSLNLVCHELRVSPALVATSQEIRNLAAWQMGQAAEEAAPGLLQGWRRHVLTNLFDDVIHGRLVLRVTDPTSPNPVRLERWVPPPQPPE